MRCSAEAAKATNEVRVPDSSRRGAYVRLFGVGGGWALPGGRNIARRAGAVKESQLGSVMGRPSPLWTRDQVAARILAGESIVVIDNQVVRIPPSWLSSHPGGSLAILHFIGRDATDEVHAFHSTETLQRMKGYVVGTIGTADEGWLPLVPPIMNGWVRQLGQDGKAEWYNEATAMRTSQDIPSAPASEILLVKRDDCAPGSLGPSLSTLQPPPTTLTPKLQAQHSAAYKELHRRVTEAGLYDTPFLTGYGPEFVRYSLLALFAAFLYSKDWLIPSAISLGLCWQQLTFFAHDLGHVGVTHNWVWDRIIAIFVADFVGGLSIGWWVNVRPANLCLQ